MARILWPNGTDQPPNFSAEGHFGYRNSTAPGASKFHRGLDMWGIGRIRAIADGVVVAKGWGPYGWGGGYQVWIQHDGFFTRSLHMMADSSPVGIGDRVTAGDFIGREGSTGAYQEHLHLEITPGQWHAANTGQVDPKAWLFEHVQTGAPAGIDQGAPAPNSEPAPRGISINRSVKGDIMAESYVAAAGDKGLYPRGRVIYTRPGLRKDFASQEDYHAWQETINGLIDEGCSNQLRVPPLPEVKKLSDWRVKAILDANGV